MDTLPPGPGDTPMDVSLTILLAEDDEDLALIYGTYLRRAGHRVMHVGDGAAALRVVETAEPDLLVLDLNMPVLSGEDTLRRLRQDAATRLRPVVLFTTRDLDDATGGAITALGVEAVITKVSMPPNDFVGWLRRWATGRPLPVRREAREPAGPA